MKIAIVGIKGLPADYGGFETFSASLIRTSMKMHPDLSYIVVCENSYKKNLLNQNIKCERIFINLSANGWQGLFYDAIGLWKVRKKVDIILLLGASGSWFLPIFKHFTDAKIVANVDGKESSRAKWTGLVKLILKILEKFLVKFSDTVVSDNDGIKEDIKNVYGKSSTMIPYGFDKIPKNFFNEGFYKKFQLDKYPYYLAMARAEPENNCEIILEAFSKRSDLNLRFLGNWENTDYGKYLLKKYESHKNIHMMNAVYDESFISAIRMGCKGYVHGHSVGGTNPSLVEILPYDKPIFSFDCKYNRYTLKNMGMYFYDVNSLLEVITSANETDKFNYKEILHLYDSSYICDQYINLFRKINNRV